MPLKLRNSTIETLAQMCKQDNKSLYCFGSGLQPEQMCEKFANTKIQEHITAFVDNDTTKSGNTKTLCGQYIPIISLEQFAKAADNNTILLITSRFYGEIVAQLDNIPELDGVECYIYTFCEQHFVPQTFEYTKPTTQKIPRKIHYCWFGGKEIPDQFKRYMESWSKFCPDYEIIRWDENNYDVTKSVYMKQAYDAKKWAFVSDYARLDVVYEHGGIYLDTDVELVKNLDDLLYDEMFCGFERVDSIAFGLGFGAIKRHRIMAEIISIYNQIQFINADGSYNQEPCPTLQTAVLKKYSSVLNGHYQRLKDCVVYPIDVLSPTAFCTGTLNYTENTHAIHHFSGTWDTSDNAKRMSCNTKIAKRIQAE